MSEAIDSCGTEEAGCLTHFAAHQATPRVSTPFAANPTAHIPCRLRDLFDFKSFAEINNTALDSFPRLLLGLGEKTRWQTHSSGGVDISKRSFISLSSHSRKPSENLSLSCKIKKLGKLIRDANLQSSRPHVFGLRRGIQIYAYFPPSTVRALDSMRRSVQVAVSEAFDHIRQHLRHT